MKSLLKYSLPISLALCLAACGGSKHKTDTIEKPEAVYNLHPDDVAEYIEEFKYQYDQLELQIEGVPYKIRTLATDLEKNVVYTKFERGFLIFGFDFEENEPINNLIVIETETTDLDVALTELDAVLFGKDIDVELDDDNAIYTGKIYNNSTQEFNVRLLINSSAIEGGSSVMDIDGNVAALNGELGTLTYLQIQYLIDNNPEVTTLLLQVIEGSVNDDINAHTGRLIRNAQLETKVNNNSRIYSGGVDLFSAGFKRIYESGATVGVHSWCCEEGKPADKLSKDDPAHGSQLTYFREMLGDDLGPEFYFFTLNAASFDGIHVMTTDELEKYLLTKD